MDRARAAGESPSARGMTLIEVLASAGVLVVIFMAITSLILSTRRLQNAVQESEVAVFHAEGVKERIGTTSFSAIAATFPADGSDVSSATGIQAALANERITVEYPGWDWATWNATGQDPDDVPDPLTIRIQVAWLDAETGAARTERLVVVRSGSVP